MDERYDVVVVGAGLAGVAAAATAAGSGGSTLVLDGHQPGGRGSPHQRGRLPVNPGAPALSLGRPTPYRRGGARAAAGGAAGQIRGAGPRGAPSPRGGGASRVGAGGAPARRNGAEIRTSAAVRSVATEPDRVVVTVDGRE